MTLLKINRDFFIEALSTNIDSLFGDGWFLDTETGDVLLHTADNLEEYPDDFPDDARYIHIESIPSDEAFQIMVDFVDQLENADTASRLSTILREPKPFRHFKDYLYTIDGLETAWYAFEQQAYSKLADAWCEENDIKAEWV